MDYTTRSSHNSNNDHSFTSIAIQYCIDKIINISNTILIPIFKILSVISVVLLLSIIILAYLRLTLIPKAIINERLYFDYSRSQPTALLHLSNAGKQWIDRSKMETAVASDSDYHMSNETRLYKRIPQENPRHYLKSGQAYNIDTTFTVAKSPRNYEIGAMPLTMSVIDVDGQVIASSARAIVMVYRSPLSLYLESLVTFPLRVSGCLPWSETFDTQIRFMRDFREPTQIKLGKPYVAQSGLTSADNDIVVPTASDVIKLHMHYPIMDISEAYLTVMPQLRGLSYFLYYFPLWSSVIGIPIIFVIQMFLYSGIYIVIVLISMVNKAMQDANGRTVPSADMAPQQQAVQTHVSTCKSDDIARTVNGRVAGEARPACETDPTHQLYKERQYQSQQNKGLNIQRNNETKANSTRNYKVDDQQDKFKYSTFVNSNRSVEQLMKELPIDYDDLIGEDVEDESDDGSIASGSSYSSNSSGRASSTGSPDYGALWWNWWTGKTTKLD